MISISPARRNRAILTAAATLVVAWLLFSARGVLFPFIFGLVFAYLLLPLVNRIERVIPLPQRMRGLARLVSVLIVYTAFVALFTIAIALVGPTLAHQTGNFVDSLPQYYTQTQDFFEGWLGSFRAKVPQDMQALIEKEITGALGAVGGLVQGALLQTVKIVSLTFSLIIAIVSIPVWLFYILKDERQLMGSFYSLFSPSIRPDVEEVLRRADKALSAYIRAQLLLGLIVGVLIYVGLLALNVELALTLAIVAGITELIPVVGPIIGAIPALLVTLATAPESALWVLLLFVVVQSVENNLLVPRIQGSAVNIHPAVIMVLLIVASEVAGVVGMIVAVPLAAMSREIFTYLYHRLGQEGEGPSPTQGT
ncbi:MAG: hypothetical protein HW403_288 [Dehalococcoidia bacterium]|nr:hypothetical protein [Dehalococcoidia bacterium]